MEKYRNKISYLEKENSVKINENVHLEQKMKELEKNGKKEFSKFYIEILLKIRCHHFKKLPKKSFTR